MKRPVGSGLVAATIVALIAASVGPAAGQSPSPSPAPSDQAEGVPPSGCPAIPGVVESDASAPPLSAVPTAASPLPTLPLPSASEEPGSASRPSVEALRGLFAEEQPTADFADVRRDYECFVAANPDIAAMDLASGVARLLPDCQRELERGRRYDACSNVFPNLALLWAQTGATGLFDLLGPFIGATVPAYKGERRKNYVRSLENTPDALEQFYPELFSE